MNSTRCLSFRPDRVVVFYSMFGPMPIYQVYYGGDIVNRTYGTRKNSLILAFVLTIYGPITYGPPYYITFRFVYTVMVLLA